MKSFRRKSIRSKPSALDLRLDESDLSANVTGVEPVGRRDVVTIVVSTGVRIYNCYRCVDAFGELHVQLRRAFPLIDIPSPPLPRSDGEADVDGSVGGASGLVPASAGAGASIAGGSVTGGGGAAGGGSVDGGSRAGSVVGSGSVAGTASVHLGADEVAELARLKDTVSDYLTALLDHAEMRGCREMQRFLREPDADTAGTAATSAVSFLMHPVPWNKTEVGAGKAVAARRKVSAKAPQVMVWEFACAREEIGFRVEVNGSVVPHYAYAVHRAGEGAGLGDDAGTAAMAEAVGAIENQRAVQGHIVLQREATVTLTWDNSFAAHPKTVLYRQEVVDYAQFTAALMASRDMTISAARRMERSPEGLAGTVSIDGSTAQELMLREHLFSLQEEIASLSTVHERAALDVQRAMAEKTNAEEHAAACESEVEEKAEVIGQLAELLRELRESLPRRKQEAFRVGMAAMATIAVRWAYGVRGAVKARDAEVQRELAEARRETQALKDERAGWEFAKKQLQKAADEAAETVKAKEEEVRAFPEKEAYYQGLLDQAKVKYDQAAKAVKVIHKEKEKLLAEIETLKSSEAATAASNELMAAQMDLDSARAALAHTRDSLESTKAELSESNAKVASNAEELKRARMALMKQTAAVKKLKAEKKVLVAEVKKRSAAGGSAASGAQSPAMSASPSPASSESPAALRLGTGPGAGAGAAAAGGADGAATPGGDSTPGDVGSDAASPLPVAAGDAPTGAGKPQAVSSTNGAAAATSVSNATTAPGARGAEGNQERRKSTSYWGQLSANLSATVENVQSTFAGTLDELVVNVQRDAADVGLISPDPPSDKAPSPASATGGAAAGGAEAPAGAADADAGAARDAPAPATEPSPPAPAEPAEPPRSDTVAPETPTEAPGSAKRKSVPRPWDSPLGNGEATNGGDTSGAAAGEPVAHVAAAAAAADAAAGSAGAGAAAGAAAADSTVASQLGTSAATSAAPDPVAAEPPAAPAAPASRAMTPAEEAMAAARAALSAAYGVGISAPRKDSSSSLDTDDISDGGLSPSPPTT